MPADEEQLALVDRLGVGLLLIGSDGIVRAANGSAHRLLGLRSGTLPGRTTMETFVDHRVESLVRGASSGGDAQTELTLPTEPARTLVIRASGLPDGRASVLIEDVSEMRRLRRIRTEFIDNLSHELRTPLTTVRLLTESLAMAAEREEVSPRLRESITKIDVETGHLVQMVSELMDLAKIEQGEAPLNLEDLDLAQVVEATVERLSPYAERNDVDLKTDFPADVDMRTVRGDSERLSQLLVNLAHNAVKFSNAGGSVIVRLRAADGEVWLEVEDQGVGITKRDLERVFERFYKVDRARADAGRGVGGTGLGLSIARHIAERHGGRIWATSVLGKGSTFIVALPRATPVAAQ